MPKRRMDRTQNEMFRVLVSIVYYYYHSDTFQNNNDSYCINNDTFIYNIEHVPK